MACSAVSDIILQIKAVTTVNIWASFTRQTKLNGAEVMYIKISNMKFFVPLQGLLVLEGSFRQTANLMQNPFFADMWTISVKVKWGWIIQLSSSYKQGKKRRWHTFKCGKGTKMQ